MAEFTVVRKRHIDADPARVHALVNDFHQWPQWSPWEDIDPAMQREYSGSEAGAGAHYAWQGNRKAGRGSMEIVGSNPHQIDIRLVFLKPWKAENDISFAIMPDNGGTDVTWTMSGSNTGMAAVVTKVFKMERLVGKDFDRGLARLKIAAEG